MNFLFYDIIFFIIFCIIAAVFLYRNKKNVKREGIIFLYRSKAGLKFMDRFAKKHPRLLNFLSTIYIAIGFAGMISIIGILIFSLQKMIAMPVVFKTPPIIPLLPWMKIPGFPMLYFTFWIIALSILAAVHEGSHGIFARHNNIKVTSSGFGFFGPLPLAFVEPDEKQLAKKAPRRSLVYSLRGLLLILLPLLFFF